MFMIITKTIKCNYTNWLLIINQVAFLCNYSERMWNGILDRPKHLMFDFTHSKLFLQKLILSLLISFKMSYWKFLNPIIKLFQLPDLGQSEALLMVWASTPFYLVEYKWCLQYSTFIWERIANVLFLVIFASLCNLSEL